MRHVQPRPARALVTRIVVSAALSLNCSKHSPVGRQPADMQALQVRPQVFGSAKSGFRGATAALQRLSLTQAPPAARSSLLVEGEWRGGRALGLGPRHIAWIRCCEAQAASGGVSGGGPPRGRRRRRARPARSRPPPVSPLVCLWSVLHILADICLSPAPCAASAAPASRAAAASRVCELTGTRANNGYTVTFSHKRNKKLQQANLQYKKVYWPEGQRCARDASAHAFRGARSRPARPRGLWL